MFWSSHLPLSSLIEMCRALRHYLGAGLSLVDAFRQQAKRGAADVRPVAARIVAALESGDSLPDALQREERYFPSLFLALTRVGEQSGMLAEVFAELEKYYVRQQTLWRQFLAASVWPAIQFVLAVLVLAGLIFIMGTIADAQGPNAKPLDPLGLGLSGPSGALIFLGVVASGLFALIGMYWYATRRLRDNAAVDRRLLRLPVIGPCLRALALARFCMALRLTTETGMSIVKAMRLSLSATGNRAFIARSEALEMKLRRGATLKDVFSDNDLFPMDFQHTINVAEESGTLDQVLAHQAAHYHDESSRRLTVMTGLAAYGVWAFVALVIIVAIFRIANWYIGLLG